MKIKSVVKETSIIINGKRHILHSSDETESVLEGIEDGYKTESYQDVINWVEENDFSD